MALLCIVKKCLRYSILLFERLNSFHFNLLDSSQCQPSAEQSLEDVRKMFVKINVEVVKLGGRNLEDCVAFFDQRSHHRDVLQLFGVGRGREVDRRCHWRRRCRCCWGRRFFGEVVQDVGSEKRRQVAGVHLVTR